MEWSWPESVLSNRERVVEELIQGRELASQLSKAFANRSLVVNGDDGGSAEGIVNKILGSFVNTLLIINGKESDQEFVSDQIQGNSSGVSGGSTGLILSLKIIMRRRSVVRALQPSRIEEVPTREERLHSWTTDTPASNIDDSHAWRKYGQKVIHNAKHPRNYFRCTHKYNQACKATKQVQQVQDHPPVFRTTYYGTHTCRDYPKASELVLDCTSPRDSSKFISFDNANCLENKQEHFTSFASSSVKEELIVKATSDHTVTSHNNHSSPSDYLLSHDDLMAFDSFWPMSEFSSSIDQYDRDDVFLKMIAES
nr:WRKY DNA-binding transcription factor 70-like [Malus domestica]